ncbi:MAG: HlyC/CorC family transporter [Deltaproteobacteria bacterium]|nr:HlyC/CorC family transporter [Deltaproteobacteria bacterium]
MITLPFSVPWPTLAAMTVLFALSFSFSGTETALFSLQKVDRNRLEQGGPTGRRVSSLLSRGSALITTILIGNETVNITLAATSAVLLEELAAQSGWQGASGLVPWLNILILTPFLVFFSEVTPKVIAFRFNSTWARAIAWPLSAFYLAVWPIRRAIVLIVDLIAAKAFKVTKDHQDTLQSSELLSLIGKSAAEGDVEEFERDIIEAVFEFGETTVSRVMTPRPEIFSVRLSIPWPQLIQTVREGGFSRVPVYGARSDDILGVLLLKDLLPFRDHPLRGPKELRELLLPPTFVPASKLAQDMLKEFIENKQHMAFVVDEHGTLVGLVTLDDLMDELVGDFLESDEVYEEILETAPGVLRVLGNIDVDDYAEETGVQLPEGEYHTVGGFVFHQLGRLPRPGDEVSHDQRLYQVTKVDGLRISELIVREVLTELDGEQA